MELNDTTMTWLLSLPWALTAFTLALFFMQAQEDAGFEEGGITTRRRAPQRGLLLRLAMPLIRPLGQLIAVLPLGASREKLAKRLAQAGHPGGLSPDEFHAARIVAIVFMGLAGMFIDNELGMMPTFTLVLVVIGFMYPDIWLKQALQKRRTRVFRDLPDMLDILRLACDAGLDLSSAMKVVVEKGRKGPMLDELELVEREIALGRTRKEAFKNFADRLQMTEINAFVVALMQADQLGASVGPILKAQSEMARTRRWQLAEALVNKMPMKMLGPLVIFIFPSSFIILFTPLLIQWMQAK